MKDLFLFKKSRIGSITHNELSDELSNPSSSWEDWIFVESLRRCVICSIFVYLSNLCWLGLCRFSHLWFLIGCVICIKTGVACDPTQSYRSLPLPGLKSVWEAQTHSAWKLEYEANHHLHTSGLVTLGDLIDVQKAGYSMSNAQKLDKWNAGVDNLGSLLNLIETMV